VYVDGPGELPVSLRAIVRYGKFTLMDRGRLLLTCELTSAAKVDEPGETSKDSRTGGDRSGLVIIL